jgi:predicted kinase
MRAIICDLDGTLADCRHRLHHVLPGAKRDWNEFFAEMSADTVIRPVRDLLEMVGAADHEGYDCAIVFSTGRPEDYRPQTDHWLYTHLPHRAQGYRLYMRPANDTRPDHVVKREMLDRIRDDGYDPFIVIDDRPSVVAMWREAGLVCLQAAPGEQPMPAEAELTLMVGPSGGGKSSWLETKRMLMNGNDDLDFDVYGCQILSSDGIRGEYGDFRDQSRNQQVFEALHDIARARLKHGLDVVIDATHLRRKGRMSAAQLVPATNPVRYVVIDRPLEEKIATRGWRPESLVRKHHQHMQSQIKDILAGDGLPNVTVYDLRKSA